MGNTREVFPVQIAEPLDGGSAHAVGKAAGCDGQEEEWQTHDERKGFRPIAMLPTMYRLYTKVRQQLAGRRG